jgi:creatinine amidohydrolase
MEEVFIERMNWKDIKQAIADGKRRVLVIAGAMEQHGPHMPIGTDTFLGYALGERVARKLGGTLVAPVISLGYSIGHMPFPGTITLSEETLERVIAECCESLAHHGFTEIVILASHGGNYRAIKEVLPSLQQKLAPVTVLGATSFDPAAERIRRIAEQRGLDPIRVGVHSGQGETSMMLAHQPELVKMERAVEGFTGDASIRWRSRVPPPMDTMSPTGILGDARGSTAEIGEFFLEQEALALAEQIRAKHLE